jgi:energy-coupling factor transporter ATP-binding protein EcfA2
MATKLHLPNLERAILRDFTLYRRNNEIEATFDRNVFCLAGANGLGKSTFVAAINFALTGRVADPERSFESTEEYYRYTEDFTKRFFDGRISGRDRSTAEVEVVFTVADRRFRIVRGIFEPSGLRSFHLDDTDVSDVVAAGEVESLDLHYRTHLAQAVGVTTFDQFVFLQLFLLTFDERRHLAFWDMRVLTRILFLAFGVDPSDANRADLLTREDEKYDSIVRNTQWQATQTRKNLKSLEKFLGGDTDSADLLLEYEGLTRERDEASKNAETLEGIARDARLALADTSARLALLEQDYEDAYRARSLRTAHPSRHPLVLESLNTGRCGLCGEAGDMIRGHIEQATAGHVCPLCSTDLTSRDSADLTDLKELDARMSTSRDQLIEQRRRTAEVDRELASALQKLRNAEDRVGRFESDNEDLVRRREDSGHGIKDAIDAHLKSIQKLMDKKREATDKRDHARSQLRNLQRRLSTAYASVENEFVPIFQKLATDFLGLSLDVRFEQRAGGIILILTVENAERRLPYQLSESQRFFVDIALRMAVATFMANEQRLCMLVDTPEGSLDAAYESRAGDMFARFATGGSQLIMTANINTSQLLIRLAKRCGSERMRLARMTEWTDLTAVQVEEEEIFNAAFDTIEESLLAAGAR